MLEGLNPSEASTRVEQLLYTPRRLEDTEANDLGPERWQAFSQSFQTVIASFSLNHEQHLAVRKAFSRRVSLIQGPPGTGKTKTAVALIYLWACSNISLKRVSSSNGKPPLILLLGPSNQSVLVGVTGLRGLPEVGTVGQPRTIQVTHMVRRTLAELQETPGTLSWEVEHHRTFGPLIQKARNDVEIARKKLVNLRPASGASVSQKAAETQLKNYEELNKRLNKLIIEAERAVISASPILCSTLSSWAVFLLRQGDYSFPNVEQVLVDEAAQSTEPETMLALAYSCVDRSDGLRCLVVNPFLRNIVLVGDHMQLRPIVSESRRLAAQSEALLLCSHVSGLDQSLFERIARQVASPSVFTLLQVQYRMHPSICMWPSQAFYFGKLVTDHSVQQRPQLLPPFLFPAYRIPPSFCCCGLSRRG